MQPNYADPVAGLLNYGGYDFGRRNDPWPDYLELGFTRAHVPELLRMTMDDDLNAADRDGTEVWAPLHAWRTLGQLRTVEAAEPLARLFEKFPFDDWLAADLPLVFSLIGPASIPTITGFLGDHEVDEMGRISAPACLEQIALDYPDHRDECVGALERLLSRHDISEPTLNAFLIFSLIDLMAVETIGAIRKAFSADCVDLTIQGDVEDVEISMKLRDTRDTPRPRHGIFSDISGFDLGEDDWDILETAASPAGNGGGGTVTNPFKTVGRNDRCPCGSGKKYKKCCLN